MFYSLLLYSLYPSLTHSHWTPSLAPSLIHPNKGEIMGKLYNGIKKLMEREAMVGTPAEKEAEEADTKVRTW